MDSLKSYITEIAVKASNIPSEAERAVQKLQKELTRILGSRYVIRSRFSSNLGYTLYLRIIDTEPVNNIDQNSPVFMQFIMHLTNNYGKKEDIDKVSWEMTQGPRSLSYRKISSAISIENATDKLIQWLKQNKLKLDALLYPLKESSNIVSENNSSERKVNGIFNKENIAKMHKSQPFEFGDILVSRKNEKFTVTKVEPIKRIFPGGKTFNQGVAIDIVGGSRGKVFTIYLD